MVDVLFKTGSVVVLLGGLIFVHELGHFLVAKLLHVKVVRFSIGFGPKIAGFVRGETEYRIAVLPLGGYVKMAGEDPTQEVPPEDRGRGFLEQAPWKRLAIAFAGPGMNILFPFFVYVALALAQNGERVPGPVVGTVSPGSPAARAGLATGDRILSVGAPGLPAQPVRYFSDLRDLVSPHPGAPLEFKVRRGPRELSLEITPAAEDDSNPVEVRQRGVIGVTPTYPAALVAPAAPGGAGPVEPLDLVTRVDGAEVRNAGELTAALARARCAPVSLEVRRGDGGARRPLPLAAVPSCLPGGAPSLRIADPTVSTYVARVDPGSPAAAAGLRRGDELVAIDGAPVRSYRDVNSLGRAFQPGRPVRLALGDGRIATLVPGTERFRDEITREPGVRPLLGFHLEDRSGVDTRALLVEEVPLHHGLVEAAALSAEQLWEVVRLTVLGIARIVTGHISFRSVGGTLMLFQIASEAAEAGLGTYLFQMALISVNLGLMNLLPIPVLDGGHIVTAAVEGVTRRRLSLRAREVANWVGLALLLGLMAVAFTNDLVRIWG